MLDTGWRRCAWGMYVRIIDVYALSIWQVCARSVGSIWTIHLRDATPVLEGRSGTFAGGKAAAVRAAKRLLKKGGGSED